MRHITLTMLLLTFLGLFAKAQPGVQGAIEPAALSGARISGNIIDDKGMALEAVTVTLLRAADSGRVKETVTNKAGHFVFSDVSAGKYLRAKVPGSCRRSS